MNEFSHVSDFLIFQKTKESHKVKELVGLKGWLVYLNFLAYLRKHKYIDRNSNVFYQFQLDTSSLIEESIDFVYDTIMLLVDFNIFGFAQMPNTSGSFYHYYLTEYLDTRFVNSSRSAKARWNKS